MTSRGQGIRGEISELAWGPYLSPAISNTPHLEKYNDSPRVDLQAKETNILLIIEISEEAGCSKCDSRFMTHRDEGAMPDL